MTGVVITGWAINSPLGDNVDANMHALYYKKSNFTKIDSYNISDSSVKYAGKCEHINTSILKDKKIKKVLTRKDLLGVCTACEAAKNANIEVNIPYRIGIYVGVSCSQMGDFSDYFMLMSECADLTNQTFDSKKFGQEIHEKINPIVVLKLLMNNTLAYSSIELNIKGHNYNFMEFEVAGAKALYEAFKAIQEEKIDIAIAGATSSPLEPFQMINAYLWNLLIQDQSKMCIPKPYDAFRQGTLLSEAAAFVVLENEEHAIKRQANILGRILGFGYGTGNKSFFLDMDDMLSYNTVITDDSFGTQKSLKALLNYLHIDLSDIGFILSSANGSVVLDKYEANDLYLFLKSNGGLDIPITSSKGAVGESLESSFVLNTIYSICMLKSQKIIPTLGYDIASPETLDLNICQDIINISNKRFGVVIATGLNGISYAMICSI